MASPAPFKEPLLGESEGVPGTTCNICGSTEFVPGFQGRLTNGRAPMCAQCHCVERHRIARAVYVELRPLLADWRALQFAPERSVEPTWFKSYRGSNFGTETSLRMENTGLPDNSFDIIISNHVLEHVGDERAAIHDSFRLLGGSGVLHLMVPTPLFRWETTDWGFPDPKINEHYRDYGADFGLHISAMLDGTHGFAVTGTDPVTQSPDTMYFFSRSLDRLGELARQLQHRAIPLVRFA